MDVDLTAVEVVFAQKLACGEPVTRQRAFRTLQDWIKQQSSTRPFTEADMMRLCKGLHYVLWMQDKMLLQEELADRISQLLLVFTSEEERVLFIESVFKSLAKEWNHIDRWRMDKFLMARWKKSYRDPYWAAFTRTTISADRSFPDGLKFHFASLVLDEMDNAEIFATILHQKSEEVVARAELGDDAAPSEPAGIEFDYSALGKLLFDVGKKPETISKRRKKLYDLVKRFEVAARDGDPYHFEVPEPEIELTGKDLAEAEANLKKLEEEVILERQRMKLEKRQRRLDDEIENKRPRKDDEAEDDREEAAEANGTKVKKLPKKKSKSLKPGLKIKKRKMMTSKHFKLKAAKARSGEKERAKEVLVARLRKDGWVTEVKAMARRMIKERGVDNVNLEMLYDELKQPARRLVSEEAKKELYLIVRDWVAQRCDVEL
ncbi:unnamed protein product [Nippostrongylus brasiliensis]|uniref:Transcription and mRNA export factor ENY2 n=1 Tax=Nippostrongylus brasiliensis TaxID=27835 RepID=A0A158R2C2_NIPBR|nr:unnamed protein product [Nippostrongylus brasiliensis]